MVSKPSIKFRGLAESHGRRGRRDCRDSPANSLPLWQMEKSPSEESGCQRTPSSVFKLNHRDPAEVSPGDAGDGEHRTNGILQQSVCLLRCIETYLYPKPSKFYAAKQPLWRSGRRQKRAGSVRTRQVACKLRKSSSTAFQTPAWPKPSLSSLWWHQPFIARCFARWLDQWRTSARTGIVEVRQGGRVDHVPPRGSQLNPPEG